MTDPTLCIYHGNCPDGFTSAWVVWRRWGSAVQFYPGVHGEAPPDVTGHHVLIVDFSYKQAVMRDLATKAASITVLDHHKSAMADLCPLIDEGAIQGTFDMDHSGAMLTFQHCFPDHQAPRLVQHIEDRDLWRFALPGTRQIGMCISSHEYTFDNWSALSARCEYDEGWTGMYTEGNVLERRQAKDIKEILSVATRRMTIGGYDVPVANLPYIMASDAGNILAQGEPFGACYYDRGDGLRVFSLRSTEDGVDVSLIASQYGGGGHKHASGFGVPFTELAAKGLF